MKHYLLGTALAALLSLDSGAAGAAVLTNGTGDGTLQVNVTNFGSFGSAVSGAGNAVYDPVGDIGPAGTTYESFVLFPIAGGRDRADHLATSAFPDPAGPGSVASLVLEQTDTRLVTEFNINLLSITLTQTLTDSFDAGARVGTVLSQSFAITNTANVPNSFDIVRYIDGDLAFDGSISDAGGITSAGANRILFETDSSSAGETSTTFLGITSSVSGQNTSILGQNYELGQFSSQRSRIYAGGVLSNTIQGDNDGDGFTDGSFDVTLALQNYVTIPGGGSITYTTQTLFGNAVPPSPGQIEALPLLPDSLGPQGGFVFTVSADDFEDGETFWIDPVIAVGYTYEVTGATFASVTAPSLSSVDDADGYILTYEGSGPITLLAGEQYVFGPGVSFFTLTGIDPALALDPANELAFVTGIGLIFSSQFGTITQTPITFDTDGSGPAPIPLPASALLLGAGMGILGLRRAAKRAA